MTDINSIRSQVVTAAGSYARSYPGEVDRVTSAIAEHGTVQAGKDYLASRGYGSYAYLLDSVVLDEVAQSNGFDKATACEVIRAFITTGAPHLDGAQGASPEQVTALLQIAGLEDVPEPEVEVPVEDSVDPSLFQRLVAFARGHGFSG